MFETLSENLQKVVDFIAGKKTLTEKNIEDALREVRTALLSADVSFKIAREFVESVKKRVLGQEVIKGVQPGQQFIKAVYDSLVELLGNQAYQLPFASTGPTIYMMVGLQGSGKTTTCAKFGKYLSKKGRRPLLVAADLARPAAVEQLKTLGRQINIPVFSQEKEKPLVVCKNALKEFESFNADTLIIDTQGRLHVDEQLMAELKEVKSAINPTQTLLVLDSMTGQDAVNSAAKFNTEIGIDGIILTKLDGDAKGGAALSCKAVTQKPIIMIGVGEKVDALEEFHPDRMASRILGMGDVVSLVEKAQDAVTEKERAEMAEKLLSGQFTYDFLLQQLQMVSKMGSIQDMLKMIPGVGKLMQGQVIDDRELKWAEAVILSMTPQERKNPELVNDPRRRARIARGSGLTMQYVNSFIKHFEEMRRVFRDLGKGKVKNKIVDQLLYIMKGINR